MFMLLQQYEDNTYGYVGLDNKDYKHGKVISEQAYDETREDYIKRCEIVFNKGQYGSNLNLDLLLNSDKFDDKIKAIEQNYGFDKIEEDCKEYDHFFKLIIALRKNCTAAADAAAENIFSNRQQDYELVMAKWGLYLERLLILGESNVREAVYDYVVLHEKEDLIFKLLHNNDDNIKYFKYFIDKNNPKAIAKLLICKINFNQKCSKKVYDLVKDYAKENKIQPLNVVLDEYKKYIK